MESFRLARTFQIPVSSPTISATLQSLLLNHTLIETLYLSEQSFLNREGQSRVAKRKSCPCSLLKRKRAVCILDKVRGRVSALCQALCRRCLWQSFPLAMIPSGWHCWCFSSALAEKLMHSTCTPILSPPGSVSSLVPKTVSSLQTHE